MSAMQLFQTRYLNRFIRGVEAVGNRLPHPFALFSGLAFVVLLLSAVLSVLDVSVTYTTAGQAGQATAETTVYVKNLLAPAELRTFIVKFVKIYATFPPLALAMIMMLGIGLFEQTGLISALLRRTILGAPPYMITALLAFIGANSNMASGAGVIFAPTIGGALFKAAGRNPWLGVATGYAAATGGFTANILVAGTDVVLSGITQAAVRSAQMTAPTHPMINWYFMIAATFVVTLAVTLVTEKHLSRLLEEGQPLRQDQQALASHALTDDEKRGLRWAGVAALAVLALLLVATVPDGALLRNSAGKLLPRSPLTSGMVAILFFTFTAIGLAYGVGARVIHTHREIPMLMEGGLRGLNAFLVVALPAAMFVYFFDRSNIDTVLAVKGAALIRDLGLGGLPLILAFVVTVSAINLFVSSGSAKWMILAQVFIPIFAASNLSPAMTQLSFRVGDSVTNGLSPLKACIPVLIGLLEQYRPKDDTRSVGIGTVISLQVGYSIALFVGLTLLLVFWYLSGLPLGPGTRATM
ncbi:MAG: AbgT family transporter [bacterium]